MRSKFNTCSLREVLKMIADASLVPGDLQVPYAWSKQDVINFMSNIMKGYPSGNVLVWQPNEDDKSGICVLPSMGPINFLPSKGHRSYILNGVNRFTSLMWMRCGPSDAWAPTENERAVWMDGTEFMLDPKTGEFDFYDMLDARKKLLVPASAIINYDMAFMRDWDKQMTLAGFSEQEIEEGFSAHEKAASIPEACCQFGVVVSRSYQAAITMRLIIQSDHPQPCSNVTSTNIGSFFTAFF